MGLMGWPDLPPLGQLRGGGGLPGLGPGLRPGEQLLRLQDDDRDDACSWSLALRLLDGSQSISGAASHG